MKATIYIVTETFKDGAKASSDTHVCTTEQDAINCREYLCKEYLKAKKYKGFKDGVFSYSTTRWSYDSDYCKFVLNIDKEDKK